MNAGIRLVAALVLTVACAGIGWSMAMAQVRRTHTLNELERAVRRLQIGMIERRLPLAEAMKDAGSALFEQAAAALEKAGPEESLSEAVRAQSRRGGALDSLTKEDETALYRLARELGQGGSQRQQLLLTETAEEIAALAEGARLKAAERGKLYTSLGALGGLALAVLLI